MMDYDGLYMQGVSMLIWTCPKVLRPGKPQDLPLDTSLLLGENPGPFQPGFADIHTVYIMYQNLNNLSLNKPDKHVFSNQGPGGLPFPKLCIQDDLEASNFLKEEPRAAVQYLYPAICGLKLGW